MYIFGSSSSPWYDGRSSNRDGIVTVNISYRLGCYGFGWTGDDNEGSLNRGLLDQIAALDWVQQNIADFVVPSTGRPSERQECVRPGSTTQTPPPRSGFMGGGGRHRRAEVGD